jgi:hypothetical protein
MYLVKTISGSLGFKGNGGSNLLIKDSFPLRYLPELNVVLYQAQQQIYFTL